MSVERINFSRLLPGICCLSLLLLIVEWKALVHLEGISGIRKASRWEDFGEGSEMNMCLLGRLIQGSEGKPGLVFWKLLEVKEVGSRETIYCILCTSLLPPQCQLQLLETSAGILWGRGASWFVHISSPVVLTPAGVCQWGSILRCFLIFPSQAPGSVSRAYFASTSPFIWLRKFK
jgi:hypothetical protein